MVNTDIKLDMVIIITLVVQSATAVWWASSLDSRLQHAEKWIERHRDIKEDLTRLETILSYVEDELAEIKETISERHSAE